MKKKIEPLDLLIICDDNTQDAALRIYNDDGKIVYYSSTRVGGIKRVSEGYVVKDVDEFAGMKYELKLLESKKMITGTVNNKED